MVHSGKTPTWSWALPLVAIALFSVASVAGFEEDFFSRPAEIAIALLVVPCLIGAVFAAVYHAEEIAHVTGEPFGTFMFLAFVP